MTDERPTPQPYEPDDGKSSEPPLRGKALRRAILRAQIKVIRDAFGNTVTTASERGTASPEDDADTHYIYRTGHLLMTRDTAARLEDALDQDDRFEGGLRIMAKPTEGLVLVAMPTLRDRSSNVLEIVELLEKEGQTKPGELAVDHLVALAAKSKFCPATEPEMVAHDAKPWPPEQEAHHKIEPDKKIRVSVVDSGLWRDAVGSPESPWLEVDDVFADATDIEIVNPSDIHPYAGHGTFAAGVIACMAPETRIEVEGALPRAGAIFESEICRQLEDALTDCDRPQIISISAGTYSTTGMLALEQLALNHQLAERDDIIVIAAAGNDSADVEFYPAASEWAVAVGSVDETGEVSDFSNFGEWVNVYARGRDVVNAFPHGDYTCYEPPNVGQVRTFHGLAQWSGTSFSTPIVAGLIAARMRDTGESPREAWTNILATATPSSDPRVGPIETVGPLT